MPIQLCDPCRNLYDRPPSIVAFAPCLGCNRTIVCTTTKSHCVQPCNICQTGAQEKELQLLNSHRLQTEELTKKYSRLKRAKAKLESDNARLKSENAQLQSEKVHLENETSRLESRVWGLEARCKQASWNIRKAVQSKTLDVDISPATDDSSNPCLSLHLNSLRDNSEYFAGLLNFAGLEVATNKVDLSDLATEGLAPAFDYFVEFIYLGDYTVLEEHKAFACVAHAMVYILADRFLSARLKPMALEKLREVLYDSSVPVLEMAVLNMVYVTYTNTYSNQPQFSAISNTNLLNVGTSSGGALYGGQSEERNENGVAHTDASRGDSCSGQNVNAEIPPTETNPLRLLVSRYIDANLECYKGEKTGLFRSLLVEFPEFARDLVFHKGPGLGVDVEVPQVLK
ncbi:hypothetical protein BJ508DRAFT_378291 [Ascobolus immersus RN42]|uniref:BTB domain-containing protein n=1 Tax=Ascobolus immersus RN42 TaxID=1160509 RepID=A0A3N4I9F7_ASCIM|nr:hypothetical protein BJ508DRAFT_378291 [Ascobolus immersus RN42]